MDVLDDCDLMTVDMDFPLQECVSAFGGSASDLEVCKLLLGVLLVGMFDPGSLEYRANGKRVEHFNVQELHRV